MGEATILVVVALAVAAHLLWGSHYSGGSGARSGSAGYYGGSHYSGGGGSRGVGVALKVVVRRSRRRGRLLWRRSLFSRWRLSQWRGSYYRGSHYYGSGGYYRGGHYYGGGPYYREVTGVGASGSALDGLGWMGSVVGCAYYSYPYYPYYASPPVVSSSNPDVCRAGATAGELLVSLRHPEGYYPYVQRCPNGWTKVAPQPLRLNSDGGYRTMKWGTEFSINLRWSGVERPARRCRQAQCHGASSPI